MRIYKKEIDKIIKIVKDFFYKKKIHIDEKNICFFFYDNINLIHVEIFILKNKYIFQFDSNGNPDKTVYYIDNITQTKKAITLYF